MNEPSPDLISKIHRLEFLLVVTFLFALLPWAGLGYAAWKLSRPELRLGDKLVAESIELRSNGSATQVSLSAGDFGGCLQLSTPEGKSIVKLIAGANGGDMTLSARDGGKYAHLGSGAGKGASLLLNGASGKQTVYLGSEDDNSGNLTINNKAGEVSVVLRDNEGHGGSISTYKDRTHVLAYLGGGLHDGGAMQLYDGEAHDYARMVLDEDKHGWFRLGREDSGGIELGTHTGNGPFVRLSAVEGRAFATLMCPTEGGEWKLGDTQGRLRAMGGWVKDGTEALKIFGEDEKEAAVVCDQSTGGFFQSYARNGRPTFSAGCDSREGAGLIAAFHPDGQQIFAAGMAEDGESGIINVFDMEGNMILRAP